MNLGSSMADDYQSYFSDAAAQGNEMKLNLAESIPAMWGTCPSGRVGRIGFQQGILEQRFSRRTTARIPWHATRKCFHFCFREEIMGLLDDPVGAIFGDSGGMETGVIDTRLGRDPEANNFLHLWNDMFNLPSGYVKEGEEAAPDYRGNMFIPELLNQAMGKMNSTIPVSIDGNVFQVLPGSNRQQAATMLSFIDPWMRFGQQLENERMGQGWSSRDPGESGLMGNFLNSLGSSAGKAAGSGIVSGVSSMFG